MRFRNLIFTLIAFRFFATLFGDPIKTDGVGQYGKVTLEELDANGLIRLNGTTVTNQIHLNGSLISQNGEIGSIDVIGQANLTETTLKGGGSIIGSIQATRSNIQAPLHILGQKAVFTASQLVGVTVKQDSGFKGKQTIELRQGTIVNGPIHFESGRGEVLIYSGSHVVGPITGGKAIKKT